MQVENIECQIAQAQIGHYLSGSGLSQEAMSQLEDHIARCADCKEALNGKRTELKAMLAPERAAVDFEAIAREAQETKPNSFASALRKKSLQQLLEPTQDLPFVYQSKSVTEALAAPVAKVEEPAIEESSVAPPEPKKAKKAATASSWKPLAYSLALAAVLIAMSLFSGNISSFLGPKLSEAQSATDAPKLLASNSPTVPGSATSNAVPSTATGETAQPSTENEPTSSVTPPDETNPASTNVQPVSTPTEPNLEAEIGNIAANSLGASAGALATTQFESAEPEIQAPVPTAPKAVVKAPAKAEVRKSNSRRVTRKRVARRSVARKSPVRSTGIKVYNP